MVIGLDGATFDLMDPWVKEGDLPNLAGCLEKGVRMNLKSTPLSNSAQAWSSFITGKNPGKHGIYDFFEHKKENYGIRFINASFRRGESLWKILGESGKRVGIINVPITYPAEEVNGFIIPGLDAPGIEEDNFSYPPTLIKLIRDNVGEYILEAGIWGYIRRGQPDVALGKLLETIDTRTRIARYLLRSQEPDLFMIVFTESDKAQHHFWKYMDPSRRESKIHADKPYAQAILKVYKKLDRSIGELLKEVGGETTVFIMSDHGAGPSSNKTMFVNNWLAELGFLTYISNGALGNTLERVSKKMLTAADSMVKKRLSRRVKERILRYFPELRNKVDSLLSLQGIDWGNTRAYSRENHPAIFINLKGREPIGTVLPGEEYEKVRSMLIKELERITCPESGERVVGRIFKKEEVYHGAELHRAPDIVFEWKNYSYIHRPSEPGSKNGFLKTLTPEELEKSEYLTRPSGIHRDYGILIGIGNHIKRGGFLKEANIIDVAPTILYRLGVPIPSDMDGRVLFEIFEDGFVNNTPFMQKEVSSEILQGDVAATYTDEESKNIEERLRGLGYID